jgi:hypothetical protein
MGNRILVPLVRPEALPPQLKGKSRNPGRPVVAWRFGGGCPVRGAYCGSGGAMSPDGQTIAYGVPHRHPVHSGLRLAAVDLTAQGQRTLPRT